MKPPKDPRLSGGWRWQLAGAFFPLSPWGEHPVVARRRSHGVRREVRGESGKSL